MKIFVLLLALSAHAEIQMDDYKGFAEKWKLVTVRYRTDSGEQRFVWANEIAEKILKMGGTDFPDGAVFAKMGFATEDDPLFANSKVPSGTKRYQFMVRDKKRYADTNGWGYALFDMNGTPSFSDAKKETAACAACHHVAASRGDVFSVMMNTSPWHEKSQPRSAASVKKSSLVFADAKPASLPSVMQKMMPPSPSVRVVQGKVAQNLFIGTLDEIRPALLHEAARSTKPAGIVSPDGQWFAFVYADDAAKKCGEATGYKSVMSAPMQTREATPSHFLVWREMCP